MPSGQRDVLVLRNETLVSRKISPEESFAAAAASSFSFLRAFLLFFFSASSPVAVVGVAVFAPVDSSDSRARFPEEPAGLLDDMAEDGGGVAAIRSKVVLLGLDLVEDLTRM